LLRHIRWPAGCHITPPLFAIIAADYIIIIITSLSIACRFDAIARYAAAACWPLLRHADTPAATISRFSAMPRQHFHFIADAAIDFFRRQPTPPRRRLCRAAFSPFTPRLLRRHFCFFLFALPPMLFAARLPFLTLDAAAIRR